MSLIQNQIGKISESVSNRFWLFILMVLSLSLLTNCQKKESASQGNISISGAWALYPMAVKWTEEFGKMYPHIRIDVSAGGAGKGVADALSGTVDLGMLSRAVFPAEKERGLWWVAVTKDAVLPTISAKNPYLEQLYERGLTQDELAKIYIHEEVKSWSDLLGKEAAKEIHVFTRSDACGAAQTWAEYLGGVQEDLKGIGVFGDPGLADAVKNDPLGIGFNNTIYIYDLNTNKKYDGLEVIPIDVNKNGAIDEDEDFYTSMDQIMQAIAAGKYPSPPARELYFVSNGKPQREIVIKFLRWILNEGQSFVKVAGYVPLDHSVIQDQFKKLD